MAAAPTKHQIEVRGLSAEVWEVDGYSFPTKKDAEAFASSEWPRTLPTGRHVTSDRYSFSAGRRDLAETRQKNIDEGTLGHNLNEELGLLRKKDGS